MKIHVAAVDYYNESRLNQTTWLILLPPLPIPPRYSAAADVHNNNNNSSKSSFPHLLRPFTLTLELSTRHEHLVGSTTDELNVSCLLIIPTLQVVILGQGEQEEDECEAIIRNHQNDSQHQRSIVTSMIRK